VTAVVAMLASVTDAAPGIRSLLAQHASRLTSAPGPTHPLAPL
jgi:hypothetical protein